MTMKMFYAWIMVLFFTTRPVFAADPPQGGEKHQPPSAAEIVAKMQSQCNLTADQVAAVAPIIEKYSTQREALRQSMKDGTADRDSVRGQMKQLKEDENQELEQILSADQMGQCKSILNPSRHKRSGGGEGGGNGGGDS